jgi:sortase A
MDKGTEPFHLKTGERALLILPRRGAMVRGNIMRTLSGFERLLLFLGLLLVSVYAVGRIYSTVYSRATLREFWRTKAIASGSGDPLQPSRGMPDFRLWAEKRVEAYQQSLATNFPPPLGVLKIPSIELEVPVLEGTEDLTLNRGVGHIEGTNAPGDGGNIGIAGHRDGFFRGLKDVHLGDTMDLYTEKGNFRYVVDEIGIVPPENVSVLAPRSNPALTLVTCYPFYFVGSAPLRYIVHASITNANNVSLSEQPDSSAKEGGGQEKR